VAKIKRKRLDRKIRVGAVSYLNTKPLIYGFEKGMMKEEMDLIIDYPANIAAALLNGTIDIGLVPVAVLPAMKEYYFVSDYAIACDGAVASVCLFSDVPVENIEAVMLDYQSQTSVELLKILLKEYWKVSPKLLQATEGYEKLIQGNTAGLVIGDRAFEQRSLSRHSYDLGLAWKSYTGLPFVFAAWISRDPLSENFISNFNKATCLGLQHLDEIVDSNPCAAFDLKKYYTGYINYKLTGQRRKGLTGFLKKISAG
jgi:chorismate dehydratase